MLSPLRKAGTALQVVPSPISTLRMNEHPLTACGLACDQFIVSHCAHLDAPSPVALAREDIARLL